MDKKAIATETARMLLKIGAVQYNPHQPFFFTTGWASPVYIECRRLISYPAFRRRITDFSLLGLQAAIQQDGCDVVAGGESAGIPFAAWIAERLDLSMIYIRKRPIGIGPNAQLEGDLPPGARVLLVEDLTTDARSKINFCDALRQAGGLPKHISVIFSYGIFPGTTDMLARQNLQLHALADWQDILRVAREDNAFDAVTLQGIEDFLADPVRWSANHGGVANYGN
ncbi:orotate phosphoribosyltransferase [Ferrovibrio sp.]|uniref:orotate phosphoribosyltransferase n=1 Tax=Ferrovibrio sp. TaxID=1917215 RepID=UPI0025BA602A|nr:orotate phosphoribosyltransferase [Ferrovibrio sp.]